ncbi:SDR family NAD(P)-dependent oxidoreductase [Actinomadura sp. LOL_016]|uniref:SDR family NAD(P)-dependent oxidoreductase n=1 Tax=unclassified Actinomadura TaxID=2626254 RepID=UPI003A7FC704
MRGTTLTVVTNEGAALSPLATEARQRLDSSGVYSATKFGVNAFSEALRQEVTTQGVRIVVIEPGFVAIEPADHITDAAMRSAARQMAAAM